MHNRRNIIYILITGRLLIGLFTGRTLFFNLSYMLGGLVAVSLIWSWLSVRWININRRTRSRRTQVGHTLDEMFIIRNRVLLPKLWLEVRDHSDLPQHNASHIVPALGARSVYRWNVQTRCVVRGEFQLGPMTLVSGDPFGLFLSQRFVAATSHVIVYPAVVNINHFDLPIGMLSGGEAQRRRSHYVTANAAGVREYVPGDSFNRIHWKSTAHRDRLMVKEFDIDPLVDIWLFADFSSVSLVEDPAIQRVDGHGPISNLPTDETVPPSTEEYVAVVTASLARYFINLDRALGFMAYIPHRELLQPDRGNRQLTHILENLAVARSFSEYSLHQMLSLEAHQFTRGTTLLIVTSSVDSAWVIEAQILARRGIRSMCIFIDPQAFGGPAAEKTIGLLRLANIPTLVIRRGDDIAFALSQRAF